MIERQSASEIWRSLAGVSGTLPDFGQEYQELNSGLIVPAARQAIKEENPLPKAFGTFVGAGGMDCGFHQAGWNVVAATEWWIAAAETYLCNLGSQDTVVHIGLEATPKAPKKERAIFEKFGGKAVRAGELFASAGTGWIASEPDHDEDQCGGYGKKPFEEPEKRHWFHSTYCAEPPHRLACEHFFLGNVRELKGRDILAALEMQPGDLDCVMGGPPCQGFSMAGTREVMDPRNSLVFEFCRLVVELQPKTMLMENVPGIMSMVTPEGVPVIDAMCLYLQEGGYGTLEALKRSLTGTNPARGAIRRPISEPNDAPKIETTPTLFDLEEANVAR